ncbi:MAG: YjbQ family protein [Rhodospirillaceae bacterium]|nr:YjbQ family protein [Rhodospirillaceae bacterium]
MRQAETELQFQTTGQGLTEITGEIADWVGLQSIGTGLLTVFCRHTSASLTIQENADPDVQRDLEAFFKRLVAEDPSLYAHTMEGPDDMPAHIRGALTDVSLAIPVSGGRMVLGTWQGIYLFEHRRRAHRRKIALHAMGGD